MRRLLVPAAVLVALAACAPPGDGTSTDGASTVAVPDDATIGVVERVVDGDTLVADVGGERERVRLLRIDAPEVARDGQPGECLADAATTGLERLTPPGSQIALATDAERRDRFGRLLAHVWVDGTWVNGALLDAGLAQVLTIPPNVAYDDAVLAAQAAARAAERGLWDPAAC